MTRNEIIEVAKGFYTDYFSEREIAFARVIIEEYKKQKAKQKPVAWMYVNTDGECEQIEYIKDEPMPDDPSITPLYATPVQWKSLTTEELSSLAEESKPLIMIKATEALLKEKNCA